MATASHDPNRALTSSAAAAAVWTRVASLFSCSCALTETTAQLERTNGGGLVN
jgi:hypothetical protein